MRNTLLVIVFTLACFCLMAEPVPEGAIRHFDSDSLLVEPAVLDSIPESDWAVSAGIVPMFTHVESSGKNWRQKVCISYNLRLFYRFPGPFELQTGISMQNMGSKGYFEHPEPYVLNYILDVKDESLRVPLILNWNFRDLPGKSQLYLGFGAYMDWVYDANMQISREYVTGVEHSLRDPRDEMGEYIPGLQLQVGSRAGSGRIELVYWRDAQSFNLQERGSEKLRRSGIMLSYSLDFVSF